MRLDSNDFSKLYDLCSREMLTFFARRTYDADAAVDLLAETFAAGFEARRQFRGDDLAAARAWLYGIARNELHGYFRRGRVERRAAERLGVEARVLSDLEYDRIEELAASHELRERVGFELEALGTDQREVLRLRVVEGRSYAQVADTLGITEETARSRGSRALRLLRESPGLRDLKEATENG
jgi:RNA polymerase sigma factor (sigma-70 family)